MEYLHRSLKHCYLRLSGAGSLANLASNLIDEFVPDQMMAYRQKNFRCSDMYKVFNEEVPYYLHNRPMSIVQHCLRAHEAASTYCMDDITMTGSHKFEVGSEQNQGTWYKVDFGSSDHHVSAGHSGHRICHANTSLPSSETRQCLGLISHIDTKTVLA